ncbi:peptidylprolyl isomerase [Geobacter hydrogenophilus]|uniref:Peptidyl-prolyl cis-trans isomerase n=1 Tax=Geobacter hydrogenophilus TaxID=40983 RepID=A0A9W6FZS9_9BACT|nr:peptidylprolyl isomerase [Geobacter hydrogenophilus]GLI38150.1 peptidyl-prolyl cis-trans isomerase [Geobacter hydrogenophilus]
MFKRIILALIICGFFSVLLIAGNADAAAKAEKAKNPVVLMETTLGAVKIELYPDKAPVSVKNFLDYVNSGFYNGTIFHRVIPGFMAQGGGFTADRKQKETKAPIKNEARNGLKNDRGTIAMARTANPDSATAQFFINVVNNDGLNRPNPDGFGYAVFGRVIEGMDVVDKIVATPTQRLNMVFANLPMTPVVITSVKAVK